MMGNMKPKGWFSGMVNLDDLALNYKEKTGNDIYILLDDNFKNLVLDITKKKFVSLNEARRNLGSFIKHMNEKNKFYKTSFNNISNIAKILGNDVKTEHIEAISTKNGAWGNLTNSLIGPKLPFNFTSEEGVRIVCSILHDGGINSELNPNFTNEYVYFRKFFLKNLKSVFGDIKNISSNPNRYECITLPKIIGIILVYGLGLEYGKKVKTDPSIPEFIFNLPPVLKWSFISQAIDEDGSIETKAKRIQIMHAVETGENNSKPPNLLTDTKKLIEDLNVDVTEPYLQSSYYIDEIRRERWAIRIRQRDLKYCWKNLSLNLNYKNKVLNSLFSR